MGEKLYHVYIMTNKKRGTLYVGVTAQLVERVGSHKQGVGSFFTRKYKLTKLVHSEEFNDIGYAIHREKQIKGWLREKKIALIEKNNPEWLDLSDSVE